VTAPMAPRATRHARDVFRRFVAPAVLALAARNPYRADLCGSAATGLAPLADLQLGGALMLGVAATVYLVAALRIARRLLGRHQA